MKTTFRHVALAAVALTSFSGVATLVPAYAQNVTEDQIRAVLMKNPQIVVDALNAAQRSEQDNRVKQLLATAKPVSERIIAGDKQVAFIGNQKGKPIVEYFDYNCHFCKQFGKDTATPLLAKDKNIKILLVHTPILGPGSERMAEFAAAAQIQGKFEKAHEFLIAQNARTLEDADKLQAGLISAAGLDKAAFEKSLGNGTAKAIVEHNSKLSQEAGVSGTPMIYVNGKVAPGAIPLGPLEAYIAG